MKTSDSSFPGSHASSGNLTQLREDEAADWLVRRNAGLKPLEEAQYQEWLAADLRHPKIYAEFEATWIELNHPRKTGHGHELARALEERAQKRTRRRRAGSLAAIGLAAAAALVFALFPTSTPSANPKARSTFSVRPNRQVLPDGSVVELNLGAEFALSFSPGKRGVRLLKGEAIFLVAKDASRPFVVQANDVEVRAVGTAFAVRHDARQVEVLVTEGRVAVERVPAVDRNSADKLASVSKAEPTYLGAGDSLTVPTHLLVTAPLKIKAVSPEELLSALAWRGMRVEFTGTPISEAVELLNQKNRIQLAIADPTIGRLQISGIFWADDPEGFVRLLETGMNVLAERTATTITLRRR